MAQQNLVPHSPDEPHDNTSRAGSAPPNEPGPGHAASGHQQRARNAGHIPTPDECLRALHQTAQLLVMDVISASKANALRGIYTTLAEQQQSQRQGDGGRQLDDQWLITMLHRHPEMAKHLEPLLSDEQIAALMKQASEGDHGLS
jgi:hypothetical protein